MNAATGAIGNTSNTEDIRSKKVYKDFELRMDYRCDGNEGVFYRSRVTYDRAWQTGIEFAIDDYTSENHHAPGAAYELIAPKPNSYYAYSSQKWNQLRIVAQGDSIEHWMNGVKVVGFKLHSSDFWKAYAATKWNGPKTMTYNVAGNQAAGFITEGYLGFQADHTGKWQIRNLRIREITGGRRLRPGKARGPETALGIP